MPQQAMQLVGLGWLGCLGQFWPRAKWATLPSVWATPVWHSTRIPEYQTAWRRAHLFAVAVAAALRC